MKTYADTSFLVQLCVDLLHVGIALALGMEVFLTFDAKQAELSNAAGLQIGP